MQTKSNKKHILKKEKITKKESIYNVKTIISIEKSKWIKKLTKYSQFK